VEQATSVSDAIPCFSSANTFIVSALQVFCPAACLSLFVKQRENEILLELNVSAQDFPAVLPENLKRIWMCL